MTTPLPSNKIEKLYQEVSGIIVEAPNRVYRAANFGMVKAYWSIGQKIVDEEQFGEDRAVYGTSLLKQLSKKLTADFGKRIYSYQFKIYASILFSISESSRTA